MCNWTNIVVTNATFYKITLPLWTLNCFFFFSSCHHKIFLHSRMTAWDFLRISVTHMTPLWQIKTILMSIICNNQFLKKEKKDKIKNIFFITVV